ncbi:MAG: putative CAMK family protein kinase [Streblomastix strix]|uniref:non-specific serine/threonine protein kinase n=1 Tax=Streblomastix strix TaxID=222440 RepID=A0A5J4X713_9EUKA|nr:MAG: putative CAMK family protein kinase [Streblomastix strix]
MKKAGKTCVIEGLKQLVDLQVNIDTDQKQIRSTLMSNGKHINFQLKENEIIKDSNISFYCHANSHIAPIYSQTLSSSLQQTTSIEQTSENQSIFLTTPISFLTQYSIAFPHIDSQQSSSISDKIRSKEKITYSDIGEGLLIRNKYIWREEDWDDEDEDIEYNGVSALCKSMRNKIGIDPACYAAMMNCEQEKNFLTKTNSLKDDQQFSVAEKTLSEFLMENKYQFAEETISDVRSVALIRVPQQEQQQQINNNKQKNNEFIEEQQQQSIDHYYITFQITAPTEVLGLMRRMAQPEITHSNITIKDNNDDQNLKEQEVEDTELNLEANVQIKNRVEFEGEITVDLDDCTVKIGDNKNSNDKVDISVQNTVSQQSSLKAQINGIEQKDFKWEITLRKKNTEINENESTSQQQLDWDKSQLKCKVSVKTGNNIEDSSDIVSDIDLSKLTIRTAQQQVNNKQPQTKQQKSTSTYEFPISMNCSSHGTPINNGISCICDQGYTSLDSTVKKEYRMCNVVAKTVLDEEYNRMSKRFGLICYYLSTNPSEFHFTVELRVTIITDNSRHLRLIKEFNQYFNGVFLPEEVEYNDFEIDTKFFGGTMGKTFLVRHKQTGVLYVMKRVDYFHEKDKRMADDEIAHMKRLSSKYTVRLIWTFIKEPDMYVITEYCSRGDLRKFITELQTLPEAERIERVWEIFAQIILGLEFMHNLNIIHRDIKPDNIFIMEDGSARLGDFGLSKVLDEKDYGSTVGTRYYRAPEVFMQGKMYFSSDVYAVGIVITECLTGKHPLIGSNDQETISNIKQGRATKLPEWIPNELKDLLLRMMNTDKDKRPTVQEIIQNEVIQSTILKIKEREMQNDNDKEKQQQATILSNPKQFSRNNLKEFRDQIHSQFFEGKNALDNIEYFELLKRALFMIRSVQTLVVSNSSVEMLSLTNDIKDMIIEIINKTQFKSKVLDCAINMGVIMEFIDLVRRTSFNEVTSQSIIQPELQQILFLPHPYLYSLDKQGAIRQIIEIILLNDESNTRNKSQVCELLNYIYIEGARIPADIQQQIIASICEQIKDDNDHVNNYAYEALVFLAVNKDNHEVIVANDVIESILAIFKKQTERETIDSEIVTYSLRILQFIYIYGTPTKQKHKLLKNL